jgi:hypothetical protein
LLWHSCRALRRRLRRLALTRNRPASPSSGPRSHPGASAEELLDLG